MTTSIEIVEPDMSRFKRSWGWILGLGILFVFLGFIGLGMLVGLTLVSMFFFGALLIVAGISHAIDVFKHRYWKGIVGHAFIAVLYIAAGCTVLYEPLLASTLITGMLAGMLIVIGITRIAMAMTLRAAKGWGWLLLAGVSAIVLGVLILLQWPMSGVWVIGMFIAIEMIVNGWTYIFIALALRNS